jgi:hypothetical protein
MRRQRRTVPVLIAELALHSWETMARRLGMMALGTCSAAEYQRMVTEKLVAAQRSALALLLPSADPGSAALAPWHRAAAANAKRLRRRKRR